MTPAAPSKEFLANLECMGGGRGGLGGVPYPELEDAGHYLRWLQSPGEEGSEQLLIHLFGDEQR